MRWIDDLLNKISMYRLVVYILGGYSVLALIFSLLNKLSFTPAHLLLSVAALLGSAYIVDRGFGRLFHTPNNTESWLITSLILFLILQPASTFAGLVALLLAGAISSASKFIIAAHGKHIFNPAAFAAAFMSLWGLQPATWWIGSTIFWPVTLLFGLAVVRKIRRFPLFLTFAAVATALQYALFVHHHQPIAIDMKHALLASPLIFLATIMLTEPATMPPRRNQQITFAGAIAVLYVTAWRFGPLIIYPEVALLIGNVLAYLVSPKFRVILKLKEAQEISDRVYNYVFEPEKPFLFLPGQYMEWTLPGVPYDSRGNRRTFTIASSPTESEVHLGVKYYDPSSTYKATLYNLQVGDTIFASQLAGNFTLRGNEGKKIAFIAGGIGITPFRSMVKYLTDTNTQSDVTLLYIVGDPQEFAYVKELTEAAKVGVKIIPIVSRSGYNIPGVLSAKVTPELLAKLIPDFKERVFYISGPNPMVDTSKNYLHHIGVPRHKIITDHFSGY